MLNEVSPANTALGFKSKKTSKIFPCPDEISAERCLTLTLSRHLLGLILLNPLSDPWFPQFIYEDNEVGEAQNFTLGSEQRRCSQEFTPAASTSKAGGANHEVEIPCHTVSSEFGLSVLHCLIIFFMPILCNLIKYFKDNNTPYINQR